MSNYQLFTVIAALIPVLLLLIAYLVRRPGAKPLGHGQQTQAPTPLVGGDGVAAGLPTELALGASAEGMGVRPQEAAAAAVGAAMETNAAQAPWGTSESVVTSALGGAPAVPTEDLFRVEVLGQRAESEPEIRARMRENMGIVSGLLFLAAVIGLLWAVGASAEGRSVGLAAAATLTVAGLWFAFKRRGLPSPQQVRRVRGRLHTVKVTLPGGKLPSERRYLGGTQPVTLPFHWERLLPSRDRDGMIEVELRDADNSVVRCDGVFSVAEEQRRFPLVPIMKPFVLSIAGLSGLAIAASATDDLSADALMLRAW